MSSFKIAPNVLSAGNIANPSGSLASVSLNSAYVHRTSGAGFAMRIFVRELAPIDEAYLSVVAYTGNALNVTMRARVYNEDPTSGIRPGSTLLATSTTTTLPTTGQTPAFARFEFATPYTPTAIGEIVWIVFDNTAAAPATDFPSTRTITPVAFPEQAYFRFYSTTNGFSTSGTVQPRGAGFYVQNGVARGMPVTQVITPLATNNRARGFYFTPPNDIELTAIQFNTPVGSNMTGISIWESTQVPTDTPIYTFNTGQTGRVSSETTGLVAFEPPFIARKGKSYYIMWTVSANSTTPDCTQIQGYSNYASIIDTLYDDFTIFPLAFVNASNQFVIDRQYQPRLQLLIGAINQPVVGGAF